VRDVQLPELDDATPGVRHAYAMIAGKLESFDPFLATSSPLPKHVDLADVLTAYLLYVRALNRFDEDTTDEDPVQRERNHYLVTRTVRATVARRKYSMTTLRTFIDVALEYPSLAVDLSAVVVTSSASWPAQAIVDSDDAGRLPRAVHDAAGVTVIIPRTDYLIRRARARARSGSLTATQFEFAKTLSTDWAGSFDELVETAKTLRPDVAGTG